MALIPDLKELFQNTSQDNFSFTCQKIGFAAVFSLMNSGNTTSLRNPLINQFQGAGIITLQQKKNWLIDWYFSNDPMGSIYLATLRNSALVRTYQTNPGMLYGTPFATGMENYFVKIKTYFGQSMFDQLVTEFAQQSNLYVDEIKVDEFHLYGSSRLGVYEANRTISRRVARDLNNDNQISNNEYEVETPEEVLYLYSSYQLERGAKRYELANHLGNVLTVISDKKIANFTGTTFTHFTAERMSATDYSPFGAPLAGRTWNGGEYRYGFNGQEKVDEISGSGNHNTALFWEYDTRLGRRWNRDPKPTTGISDYACFYNNPIWNTDLLGDKPTPKGKVSTWISKNLPGLIAAPLSGTVDLVKALGRTIGGIASFNKTKIKQGAEDMGFGLFGIIGLREAFSEKWVNGATGGRLPKSLSDEMDNVNNEVWNSGRIDAPAKNGMHSWHE